MFKSLDFMLSNLLTSILEHCALKNYKFGLFGIIRNSTHSVYTFVLSKCLFVGLLDILLNYLLTNPAISLVTKPYEF